MTSYEFAYALEDIGVMFLPGLLSGIPSFAFGLAAYVLTALGLYTMACRRGLTNAWMSWIPVLNVWIIGSLSDQYRYVVKGQVKSKRKVLLILEIIKALLTVACVVLCIVMVVGVVSSAIYGVSEAELLEEVMGSLLGALVLVLPLAVVAVAVMVLRFIAMYDIYTSCDPGNSVLFLVLSILFRVTEPFFLFFNRNRDLGMPPRKPNPQEPYTDGDVI